MNRHDNQLRDNIGDDVRSAFDDMFDEARLDATAPPLDVRVATRKAPVPSRLPVTRAAAAVAVMAAGVLVAVAVRTGRDAAPLGGPSISAVDSSLDSTPPSAGGGEPVTATFPADGPSLDALLFGTLRIDSRCVLFETDDPAGSAIAVVAAGTTVTGATLTNPDGTTVESGQRIESGGGWINREVTNGLGVSDAELDRCAAVFGLQPGANGAEIPLVQLAGPQPLDETPGTSPGATSPGSTSPGTSPGSTAPEAATPVVVAEPRQRPATAIVSVTVEDDRAGLSLPLALLTYDIATGEVVDRIDPWGEKDDYVSGSPVLWGTPNIVAGNRAVFWSQRLPPNICESTGSALTTQWPNPPIGADGLVQAEELHDFGGYVFDVSPDGNTMFYGADTECTEVVDDPNQPPENVSHLGAIVLRDVPSGEASAPPSEMTVSTRMEHSATSDSGIADAVMTASGDLVVLLKPSGDVYRLTPTDGAVVEDGVLVANVAQWANPDNGSPLLLGADDSTITVGFGPTDLTDYTVRRGPNADGGWTELVHMVGSGSVADDGYGNLIVAAAPDTSVETNPDEPITVLRVPESPDGRHLGVEW